MKVIVAGSRSIKNYSLVSQIISDILTTNKLQVTEIISGKAKEGVDPLGERWANDHGIPVKPFPAKWDDLSAPGAVIRINKFGKPYNVRAGFDRNEVMALYGDMLIAIWDGKSRGTSDMIDRAHAHGLVVFVYRANM